MIEELFSFELFDDERFDFGRALELLRAGKAVTRAHWNGRGQFVYLVPADSYPAKTDTAKKIADEFGNVTYNAYFALKTVDGSISTWVPSVTDCLAVDWMVADVK